MPSYLYTSDVKYRPNGIPLKIRFPRNWCEGWVYLVPFVKKLRESTVKATSLGRYILLGRS